MISHGASVRKRNSDRETPLHICARFASQCFLLFSCSLVFPPRNGHDEIISEVLATKKLDTNDVLEDEETTKRYALRNRFRTFVESKKFGKLHTKKGSIPQMIDEKDCLGQTALFIATKYNHLPVVKTLLKE